ncbi:MAG TPA: hypothetical protein VK935_22230, partial [Actinomycetospora sp.]|nr:hypothetical protein [Actinomycetospora sp.]
MTGATRRRPGRRVAAVVAALLLLGLAACGSCSLRSPWPAPQTASASADIRVVAVGCMAERYGAELAEALPEA